MGEIRVREPSRQRKSKRKALKQVLPWRVWKEKAKGLSEMNLVESAKGKGSGQLS